MQSKDYLSICSFCTDKCAWAQRDVKLVGGRGSWAGTIQLRMFPIVAALAGGVLAVCTSLCTAKYARRAEYNWNWFGITQPWFQPPSVLNVRQAGTIRAALRAGDCDRNFVIASQCILSGGDLRAATNFDCFLLAPLLAGIITYFFYQRMRLKRTAGPACHRARSCR